MKFADEEGAREEKKGGGRRRGGGGSEGKRERRKKRASVLLVCLLVGFLRECSCALLSFFFILRKCCSEENPLREGKHDDVIFRPSFFVGSARTIRNYLAQVPKSSSPVSFENVCTAPVASVGEDRPCTRLSSSIALVASLFRSQ